MEIEEATKILQDRTDEIQKECHSFVSSIMNESNAKYQDATNVFLFAKIAALELHIEKLIRAQKNN